ncbi:MAG: RNB domain-containing ribonuclease [Porticoccaceae bacterium]
MPFVTIDGEDSRDFDDAVYCEPRGRNGGWKLFVAIADVSHYVQVDSALDKEAWQRELNVFPQHVVPMLPEKLSNGLCSLNPHIDRLCMVCEMDLDKQGKVVRFQF